ncbi:MAG TPA: hypothetical protein PKD37_07435 [Oligoflexia bacterium]|nr:hypothetical protein [Oligoflexia bacterium]HMP27795.1 hypothetical protein [Oligoflexia bacterium]
MESQTLKLAITALLAKSKRLLRAYSSNHAAQTKELPEAQLAAYKEVFHSMVLDLSQILDGSLSQKFALELMSLRDRYHQKVIVLRGELAEEHLHFLNIASTASFLDIALKAKALFEKDSLASAYSAACGELDLILRRSGYSNFARADEIESASLNANLTAASDNVVSKEKSKLSVRKIIPFLKAIGD